VALIDAVVALVNSAQCSWEMQTDDNIKKVQAKTKVRAIEVAMTLRTNNAHCQQRKAHCKQQ